MGQCNILVDVVDEYSIQMTRQHIIVGITENAVVPLSNLSPVNNSSHYKRRVYG